MDGKPPQGQQYISPGQSGAAQPRSAALGRVAVQDNSPERATRYRRCPCFALSGLGYPMDTITQGGGTLAGLALPCPGLIYGCPLRGDAASHIEFVRVSRFSGAAANAIPYPASAVFRSLRAVRPNSSRSISRRNTSPRVARISALGWSANHSRPRQVFIIWYCWTWIC